MYVVNHLGNWILYSSTINMALHGVLLAACSKYTLKIIKMARSVSDRLYIVMTAIVCTTKSVIVICLMFFPQINQGYTVFSDPQ